MSRIGNKPVDLPNGVKVDIAGREVLISGDKGNLTQSFHPDMIIRQDERVIIVERPSDSRQHRALHGLTRSLLNNMVVGVTEGYTIKLQIQGVGYRAEMAGNTLVLSVGYSHQVKIDPPDKVQFAIEARGKEIIVTGIDKQVVGEISAKIRKVRPPEPYKGKGIRYEGEYVRRKAGKAAKV